MSLLLAWEGCSVLLLLFNCLFVFVVCICVVILYYIMFCPIPPAILMLPRALATKSLVNLFYPCVLFVVCVVFVFALCL